METEDHKPNHLLAAWHAVDLARLSLEQLMSKEELQQLCWRSRPVTEAASAEDI